MKWSLKLIAGLAFLCFVTGTGGLIYLYKTSASPIVQTVSLNSEKTFDSTGVNSVSVTSDMLDIQTVPADSDNISIRLIGDLPESKKNNWTISGETKNQALEVRIGSKNNWNVGIDIHELFLLVQTAASNNRIRIEVGLPKKEYDSLTFASDTGNLKLNGLQASSLTVTSDTGSVHLADTTSGKTRVETSTGSITMDGAGGELSVQSDTGSVKLGLGAVSQNVSVQTDTGGIALRLAEASPLRLELGSDTGRVTADLPDSAYEAKEKHSLKASVQGGGPLVRATSDTGSVSVGLGK